MFIVAKQLRTGLSNLEAVQTRFHSSFANIAVSQPLLEAQSSIACVASLLATQNRALVAVESLTQCISDVSLSMAKLVPTSILETQSQISNSLSRIAASSPFRAYAEANVQLTQAAIEPFPRSNYRIPSRHPQVSLRQMPQYHTATVINIITDLSFYEDEE